MPSLPADLRVGWQVDPPPTPLDHPIFGPIIAAALMLLPSIAVVWCANTFAQWAEPGVQAVTASASGLPACRSRCPPSSPAGHSLLTMGPLLFMWSVPTVLLFALLLGAYKASGLIDRITNVMHPHMLRLASPAAT